MRNPKVGILGSRPTCLADPIKTGVLTLLKTPGVYVYGIRVRYLTRDNGWAAEEDARFHEATRLAAQIGAGAIQRFAHLADMVDDQALADDGTLYRQSGFFETTVEKDGDDLITYGRVGSTDFEDPRGSGRAEFKVVLGPNPPASK